jgi:methionyl aminopeptidase
MIVKSEKEITSLREGGHALAEILRSVEVLVKPGIKTIELDMAAEEYIRTVGGLPSFKNYRTPGTKMPYPASLCVSVNDEVVHGIPGSRTLEEGDIVGLDIGMVYEGIFTDMAVTVGVGNIGPLYERLLLVTKKSLQLGIAAARAGGRTGDIGEAIETFAEREGFGVIKELIGHGVGGAVHEDPEIPNWGRKHTGALLKVGHVLALEPMLTIGSPRVHTTPDGWAWKTRDGERAAHFEHTILLTKEGAEIVTL